MTNAANSLVLVTGATGTTGGRVVRRLTERGVAVRAASRHGSPAFDWHDRTTWAATLDGVTAAYLAYYPDLVAPGAVEVVHRFAEAAVRAGVRRLVLLSGRGEPEAQAAERAVLSVGAAEVAVTVVRCAFFAQNFSEKGFEEFIRSGAVALPAPEVGEPFVDAEDIADVAVAALTENGHAGEVYELTGPRLLTFEQAVAEISAAGGLGLTYRRITSAEFIAGMVGQGMPEPEAAVVASIFDTVLDGRSAFLADGVRRALGREPRDFAEYARVTAATGVWRQPTTTGA